MLSKAEVAGHNSRLSCWVIIAGNAYDMTDYLDSHPGGSQILLKYAGKDATSVYEPIHPPGTVEKTLPQKQHLGPVDLVVVPQQTSSKIQSQQNVRKPHISLCLNLDDFELAAKKFLSPRAWTYFHSAADGLGSMRNNLDDWAKITLRPRVLRNVARADMRRSILGFESSLPFGIAPAALAKLAHPEGELCLARAAARKNIVYCISTGSSTSTEDIEACWRKENRGGHLFFQLYINKTKQKTLELIATARRLKFKVLVITVDCPVIGKREEDERFKIQTDLEEGMEVPWSEETDLEEERPVLRGYHSYTFTWDDLAWVKEAWGGPVVIKGIQTVEDAKAVSDIGVDGLYLSNHGGRQCDDAPSAIRTLLEIRRFCPEILGKVEIWLDGGIRRGSDVLKALCLGARAVFLGRPFMYALGVYGTDGVSRAVRGKQFSLRYSGLDLISIKVLSEEVETTMRLMGVTELSQLNESMVNTTRLEQELPRSLPAFPTHLKSYL